MTSPDFFLPSDLAPPEARVVRVLKDGYWDRTEVIERPAEGLRVRKRNHGGSASGPWGVQSLRTEIDYLATLPDGARAVFPPMLAAWDVATPAGPDIGYEMPYFDQHCDAGLLARRGQLAQPEVDRLQDELADAVLMRLHRPVEPRASLATHVTTAGHEAWTRLALDPALALLIGATQVEVNGARMLGPREAFARIVRETGVLAALDAGPCVRLHGDFFLENILWHPGAAEAGERSLLLIDPVSVAGVVAGPPCFDLVKYVSYATGELLALRSEWVEVDGFGPAGDGRHFTYHIRWDDPALEPFHRIDWHTRFRAAFAARHGRVDSRLCHLIDGYFSVAMAVNTGGIQQRARLLKATVDFNAVLAS